MSNTFNCCKPTKKIQDIDSFHEDVQDIVLNLEVLFWKLQKLDRRLLSDDSKKCWFQLLNEKAEKIIDISNEFEKFSCKIQTKTKY